MEPKTLKQAIEFFADPKNCREYLVAYRWPDGVECPRCGSKNVKFSEKYNRWQCGSHHERRQFTLKTGTIFEESPLGLDKWLAAMWLLVNSKNGISSWEVSRAIGVTQKSAWFMMHRLREVLEPQNKGAKLGGNSSGPVEIDETFVSPDPKKMHPGRRARLKQGQRDYTKAVVLGMLDREARQVRAMVIPNVKRETLQREILTHVENKSAVYTDQFASYEFLKARDFIHETVNHMEEYVRGEVHTQGIDNFWSLLKRGLSGTYISVEPFHMDRYLAEQVFRYNNRATKDNKLTDADRFALAVSQIVGKRLTYKELTGKTGEAPF
jgi:transposase-like protein